MCVCLFLDDPILKVMPKFLLISLLTTNPSRTMDANTQDQQSDYPGEGEELENSWLPEIFGSHRIDLHKHPRCFCLLCHLRLGISVGEKDCT